MATGGTRRGTVPRTGLVLGAGGVLGAAWMTGALAALQERLRRPASELDVVVGTSAGSVLAAALHCGFGVTDLVAHQRGTARGSFSALGPPELDCGPLPPFPRLRFGSPRLLLAALRAPRQVHPFVAASSCLPVGSADHARLRALVNALADQARQPSRPGTARGRPPAGARRRADGKRRRAAAAPTGVAASTTGPAPDGGGGPGGRRTWIVAVDYDTGRRVVFGRDNAPSACLADMVTASCSVPGWFRPAEIGGRRYIDGGIRSPANADLLATAGLERAYVLAPVASLSTRRPRTPVEGVERGIRRLMTAALMREVAVLRAAGTKVTVLTPGPEDLAAMGANLMDARRRVEVLETSLRTSQRSLAVAGATPQRLPGSAPAAAAA